MVSDFTAIHIPLRGCALYHKSLACVEPFRLPVEVLQVTASGTLVVDSETMPFSISQRRFTAAVS